MPAMTRRVVPPCVLALNLPDGVTKPYRPKPADFRAVYVAIGWDGIEEHFGTNWRVIRRWIEEEGPDGLRAERAAFVARKQGEKRRVKAKRYVLGRTLSGPDHERTDIVPRVVAMFREGMPQMEIARRLNRSKARIHDILEREGLLTAVKPRNREG